MDDNEGLWGEYDNPTFDTDEPTCYRGHIIPEDEWDSDCQECSDEDKRGGQS